MPQPGRTNFCLLVNIFHDPRLAAVLFPLCTIRQRTAFTCKVLTVRPHPLGQLPDPYLTWCLTRSDQPTLNRVPRSLPCVGLQQFWKLTSFNLTTRNLTFSAEAYTDHFTSRLVSSSRSHVYRKNRSASTNLYFSWNFWIYVCFFCLKMKRWGKSKIEEKIREFTVTLLT